MLLAIHLRGPGLPPASGKEILACSLCSSWGAKGKAFFWNIFLAFRRRYWAKRSDTPPLWGVSINALSLFWEEKKEWQKRERRGFLPLKTILHWSCPIYPALALHVGMCGSGGKWKKREWKGGGGKGWRKRKKAIFFPHFIIPLFWKVGDVCQTTLPPSGGPGGESLVLISVWAHPFYPSSGFSLYEKILCRIWKFSSVSADAFLVSPPFFLPICFRPAWDRERQTIGGTISSQASPSSHL